MDNAGIKNNPKGIKLFDSSFGLVVEFVVLITLISVGLRLAVSHWLG